MYNSITPAEHDALVSASRCAALCRGRGSVTVPIHLKPELIRMFQSHLASLIDCEIDTERSGMQGEWVVSIREL